MEWVAITVISVLLGIVIKILKPLLKFNTSIVENTAATNNLTKTMEKNEKTNEKEHDEIWEKVDEHGETLNDHETRLKIIEHDNKNGGAD